MVNGLREHIGNVFILTFRWTVCVSLGRWAFCTTLSLVEMNCRWDEVKCGTVLNVSIVGEEHELTYWRRLCSCFPEYWREGNCPVCDKSPSSLPWDFHEHQCNVDQEHIYGSNTIHTFYATVYMLYNSLITVQLKLVLKTPKMPLFLNTTGACGYSCRFSATQYCQLHATVMACQWCARLCSFSLAVWSAINWCNGSGC